MRGGDDCFALHLDYTYIAGHTLTPGASMNRHRRAVIPADSNTLSSSSLHVSTGLVPRPKASLADSLVSPVQHQATACRVSVASLKSPARACYMATRPWLNSPVPARRGHHQMPTKLSDARRFLRSVRYRTCTLSCLSPRLIKNDNEEKDQINNAPPKRRSAAVLPILIPPPSPTPRCFRHVHPSAS